MLGPIGSEVMAIFRLLSPDEIDNYIVEDKVARIEGTKTATGEELSHDSTKQYYSKAAQPQEDLEDEEFDIAKSAKIIPLHAYKDETENQESDEPNHQQRAKVDSPPVKASGGKGALDSLGILSAAQIREQEAARLKAERAQEDSITVFLLKERDKMRRSKQKITEQRALKLYHSSAAVDLDVEIEYDPDAEEQTNSGDMRGILVNKKQF